MARKYASTEIRQKQIAAAAARIIIKYGSEHVTTRKIADEVGISETAIYRHFKSKEELLSFLIRDVEIMLLSEIKTSNTGQPYTLETLENIIKAHMATVVERRGISFQVIAEIISLGSRKLNRQAYGVVNQYIERVKQVFQEGREAGVIRQDVDLEAAATLFFGMTQGLVNAWALSQYSFDLETRYLATWNVFREAIIT
jgi:AcrR family transcriptional regulator